MKHFYMMPINIHHVALVNGFSLCTYHVIAHGLLDGGDQNFSTEKNVDNMVNMFIYMYITNL